MLVFIYRLTGLGIQLVRRYRWAQVALIALLVLGAVNAYVAGRFTGGVRPLDPQVWATYKGQTFCLGPLPSLGITSYPVALGEPCFEGGLVTGTSGGWFCPDGMLPDPFTVHPDWPNPPLCEVSRAQP